MPDTMIERVARGIHDAHKPWCDYTYPFEDPSSGQEVYMALARAAIRALMEPTDGMAEALAATALPGEAFLRSLPPDPGRGKRAPKPTTAPPDGPPDKAWSRQRRRAWERKNGGPR